MRFLLARRRVQEERLAEQGVGAGAQLGRLEAPDLDEARQPLRDARVVAVLEIALREADLFRGGFLSVGLLRRSRLLRAGRRPREERQEGKKGDPHGSPAMSI